MNEMRLTDICDFIVDCEHKTAPLSNAGYPSIRTPNVGRGRLILQAVNRVDEATYQAWTRRAVPQAGDIIIAREAPVGNVALVMAGQQVCLGQRTVLVRPNPKKVDCRFLTYFLLGDYAQNAFRSKSIGSTVAHLNMADIRGLKLPQLPNRAKQERIADILAAYDDLIEVNQQRIAVLEEASTRLFDEWFVRFRYPGHEAVPLVESELGSIPQGWSVRSLGQLCARVTDGSHWSPTSQPAGKLMASVKDMGEWGFDLGKCRFISDEDFDSLVRNDCLPMLGDILVAKDGANLNKHTFLITEQRDDLVILSSIAILRPNEQVEREYLTAALKSPEVSTRIKQSVSGAAIPRIILKDFKKLGLIVPLLELQSRWVASFAPLAEQCRTISMANRHLHATRDLLLPKLISGEIEISAAEEAFAEAAE